MKNLLIFFLLLVASAQADVGFSFSVTTTTNITTGGTTGYVYNAVGPTDPPPDLALQLVDTNWLRVITPTNLCLEVYNTKTQGAGNMPNTFNFSTTSGTAWTAPAANKFVVTISGTTAAVVSVDGNRAPYYSRNESYLLRIRNRLYLKLTNAVPDGATVVVTNPDNTVFTNLNYAFSLVCASNRYSPVIHVNQIGFHPNNKKRAYVGCYIGTNSMEMTFSQSAFYVYDVGGLSNAYSGTLVSTVDTGEGSSDGFDSEQKVLKADFSSLTLEGTYRVYIPGLGVSTDFRIDRDAFNFVLRAYEQGELSQRCGFAPAPPYTSWKHDLCHSNANNYSLGIPSKSNDLHWADIRSAATAVNGVWNANTNLVGGFPALRTLFRWQGAGTNMTTTGGHHDAGDFSKYTTNIGMNLFNLIMGVDVAHCFDDNLGTPESGDGIPDLIQEAKWDADYLLKIQDSDGGVAFLVYPFDQNYESNPPGPYQQVLYPKTTTSTAAAGAALAFAGSSPTLKQVYPDAASNYVARARLSYQFCTNAFAQYGRTNSYDVVYSYGLFEGHRDEFTALCTSLFAATKETNFLVEAKKWTPDFTASDTKYFSWWDMYEYFGVTCDALATFIQSGRGAIGDLGAETAYFASSTNEVVQAAKRQVYMSTNNAYGLCYEEESKRAHTTPYWFTGRMAKPMATAYQIQMFHNGSSDQNFIDCAVAQNDWVMGGNPLNKTRIFGVGQKPPIIGVSQWGRFSNHGEDGPPGWLIGDIMEDCGGTYRDSDLNTVAWPKYDNNGMHKSWPMLERMEDYFNVGNSEVTIDIQGMSVYFRAWLAVTARNYTPPAARIIFPQAATNGVPMTLTALVPGVDTTQATHLWWVSGGKQYVTRQPSITFVTGNTNVTIDIRLPNGDRYSANTNITVN